MEWYIKEGTVYLYPEDGTIVESALWINLKKGRKKRNLLKIVELLITILVWCKKYLLAQTAFTMAQGRTVINET